MNTITFITWFSSLNLDNKYLPIAKFEFLDLKYDYEKLITFDMINNMPDNETINVDDVCCLEDFTKEVEERGMNLYNRIIIHHIYEIEKPEDFYKTTAMYDAEDTRSGYIPVSSLDCDHAALLHFLKVVLVDLRKYEKYEGGDGYVEYTDKDAVGDDKSKWYMKESVKEVFLNLVKNKEIFGIK